MKDNDKTKEQLTEELEALRLRIAELEKSEAERKQMEAELRKSNEINFNLIEQSPHPVVVVKWDSTLIRVNQALERLTGYSSSELIGIKSPFPWFTEQGYEKKKERDRKAALARKGQKFEEKFKKKNEQLFWVEITPTAVVIDGKPVYHLLMWTDITERKRAEEKVRHLNQILQLVRRINQLIIQVDNESELLQKACDRLIDGRNYKMAWIGFTQEGSYDIMPVAQAGFEEGYLSSVKITWDDSEYGSGPTGMAIKTGRPFVMRDILNDERYRPWRDEALKRGYTSSIALPLTVENKIIGALNVYSGYPDAFDDAELDLLVELAGDISLGIEKIRQREERKRAEEQIKQLQEYLQLQVERMPIGLIAWDTEFRVQAWNPAAEKIFGFTAEEALGKHPYDLIVPKEAQAHVDNIWRQLLKGDMTARSINENITKDGRTIIWCDWSNTPLRKADGTVVGVLSMVQDITELKRAEEKAREVQVLRELGRLQSELLANVSHELRTPLTSIKGFSSTLLQPDVKWSEEEKQDFLQTIDEEADRLTRIISDLLDISRLEAGALKLEKRNYQVSEILDSVSSRLASLTQHHQLQVIVPAELPSVFVDEMHIGQVLTNLVENATKYSKEGSLITVEAQLADDQIIVSVSDRGQGIPSELLDRVFDRFYQAESIVTGQKSGTGLGLSICRGIIGVHGGKIWVESKVGEGSKFSFSLPVGKREE